MNKKAEIDIMTLILIAAILGGGYWAYTQGYFDSFLNPTNSTCIPNWQTGSWSSCINLQQTRTVKDLNSCGINLEKPVSSQACSSTCTPDWDCSVWSACTAGTQIRTCTDSNNCGQINPNSLNQSCTVTPGCPYTSGYSDTCLKLGQVDSAWRSGLCTMQFYLSEVLYLQGFPSEYAKVNSSGNSFRCSNPQSECTTCQNLVQIYTATPQNLTKYNMCKYNLQTNYPTEYSKWGGPGNPTCTSQTYSTLAEYLTANPNVNSYINQQATEVKNAFNLNLNKLESNQQMDVSTGTNLMGAKIALSVYIDKHNFVSWKLNDYSQADLATIMTAVPSAVTDCDPLNTYNYGKSYIQSTKAATIKSVIDSMRRYGHAMGNCDQSGCVKDILPQNAVCGCHAASQIMASILTDLNIPAYYRYNYESENWFVGGHGELIIPDIGYISHGDMIYGNTILKNIPSDKLIIPWSYLQNQVIPAQSSPSYTFGVGRNPKEQRYMWDILKQYPTNGQNIPKSSCIHYAHELGDGVATEAEITAMVDSWNCMEGFSIWNIFSFFNWDKIEPPNNPLDVPLQKSS